MTMDVPPGSAPGRVHLVVDASVAIKWFIPEIMTAEALRVRDALWDGAAQGTVPDLWCVEVGNILWKKATRISPAEITVAKAAEILEALLGTALRIEPLVPLLPAAFGIAATTGLTVYDATYVALAARDGAQLVTADNRLTGRLRGTEYDAVAVPLAQIASVLL